RTPCELESALEPRRRDAGLVACDAELSQGLERPPLGARIADLGGDGVALLGVREPTRDCAAAHVDRRGGEERLRPKGRALRGGGGGLVEPPLRLVEVDPA